MRLMRILAIAALVLAGFVFVTTQEGFSRPPHWAASLFDEHKHDFGPVARGGIVRHPFAVVNRLSEPITIIDVHASCGCTTGQATVSTLPPGGKGFVIAQMDTRNFVGRKETILFVNIVTAGGREAEVRLEVASDILSDIVINPGFVSFGNVSRGQTPKQTVTIERLGSPDWKATRLLSASRVLTANLEESSRSGAGVAYALTVALKPDAPSGVVDDEIVVLTNDRENPKIPIRVSTRSAAT